MKQIKNTLLFILWVIFCLFYVLVIPMLAILTNNAWGLLILAAWITGYILMAKNPTIDIDY